MMRHKVETAVQWFYKPYAMFAGFSGQGNSIYNIIRQLKNKMYI